MIYNLSEQDANKVVSLKDVGVVTVPEKAPSGTVFILFNDSNEFMTIERKTGTTYLTANNKPRTHMEFPPRCLANVLFVNETTAVVSRGLT